MTEASTQRLPTTTLFVVASAMSTLLLLASCGGAPTAVTDTTASSTEAPAHLQLTLHAASPTGPGRLALAWVPKATYDAVRSGQPTDAHLYTLLVAMHPAEPRALGPDAVTLELPVPDEPGRYVAVFQPAGEPLYAALMGHPNESQWTADSDPISAGETRASVTLARGAAAPERPEPCVGERRELVRLDVPEVRGVVGNDTDRRLCAMLPPSYANDPARRYPVVFLLPGLGGHHARYTHLADENAEVILIGVDGRTTFGATYFHDSAYGGAWERFIERAVETVDERYRTVANPAHRGLVGHSTGGYNAVSLALRRPDLFGAAGASSPDGLDLAAWLLANGRVRDDWRSLARVEDALGSPGQMVSYAAQFDDADRVRWPFDLTTGELDPERWARWRAASPMSRLDDAETAGHLDGRLFISVGRRDAFGLFEPAERFHRRLEELGVEHEWRPTDEGHFDGAERRLVEALRYVVQAM